MRPPPLSAVPADIVTPDDYARYAAERLSPAVLAHLEGGAGDEITLRRNREAFDRIFLNTRPLARVIGGHTRLTLFGREYAHPFLLAPIAHQRDFHPDGEIASARGAAAFDAPFIAPLFGSFSIGETAAAAPDAKLWFQIYPRQDAGFNATLLARAEAAGCEAVVVTIDAPFAGVRHRARRAGYAFPADAACPNLQGEPPPAKRDMPADASAVFDGVMAVMPTWADIARLRKQTTFPMLLKGIAHPDDALRALDAGADGIVVSNHGGRSFDGMPAAVEMLPAVVSRLGGRIPVLLDGGVTRGADALKAIALGANAVLIGRAYARALAAAGAMGVAHTLKMLREELEAAMSVAGCTRLTDIGPGVIFQGRENRF